MQSSSSQARQRADAEIFADARSALDHDAKVPATVRVHIEQGVATLTGSVRVPAERAEAVRVIRGVEGIRHLVNKITVTQRVSADDFEAP